MTITFTELYQDTHAFNTGTVQINTPFSGNTLAVELTTKPEYANTKQVIGYLFQFYGNAQKSYALYSGKDVVRLELPETDKLWFSPTSYLSDNYTLTIGYTDVGTIIANSTGVSIPEQILALPNRVTDLEGDVSSVVSDVTILRGDVDDLQASLSAPLWSSISGKPLVFPPDTHSHEISDVLGLSTALASKADTAHTQAISSITGLQTNLDSLASSIATNTSNIAANTSSISSKASQSDLASLTGRVATLESASLSTSGSNQNFISLSANQTLESNKNYIAVTASLVCPLPPSPIIGDVINLDNASTGTLQINKNTGQNIYDVNTQANVTTGLLLYPNAVLQLVYQGSGLWITGYRNTFQSLPLKQSYTALSLESYTFTSGYEINKINDGNNSAGAMKSGGGTTNELRVLATFTTPVILSAFDYYRGQYNGAFNMPTSVDVYRGNAIDSSKLLQSLSFPSQNGSSSIPTNDKASTTYTFNFKASSNNISVNELVLYGYALFGAVLPV